MKVSIAMATYNGAEYIEEQLYSFINQTRQPDEVVITDDCSIDRTSKIVSEFSRVAPFDVFFSVNDVNLGYTGNFNEALNKATGDIVFLSDQDDVWFPEKIKIVTDAAVNNPEALLIMNDAELTDQELKRTGLTKLDQIFASGQGENGFVMGCCCAVRRELLDFCLPIPEEIKGHDNWIVGFADRMDRRLVLREVLQLYRRHNNNESHYLANSTKKINKITTLLSEVKTIKKSRNGEIYNDSLNQAKIMRDAVLNPPKKNSLPGDDLKKVEFSLSKKIFKMERRIDIRRRPFVKRVFSAFIFAAQGGYNCSGGLKKFIRDCYG
ncbi:glycosyltransferase family 2 protein [Alcanivorax sp. NBRC 102028]|uniref:glycosyltransferase family 2 protein n=1 Tax=Alcanivorax sp. NBRC 102028 TaxID=1113897 RepID=UPI000789FB61|nr:glycosyltransferase family 2 protein [Alcanivorax sp. NBRC 102028]